MLSRNTANTWIGIGGQQGVSFELERFLGVSSAEEGLRQMAESRALEKMIGVLISIPPSLGLAGGFPCLF